MVGGCEYDPLHARPVSGFEQIIAADDVGTVDRLPGSFDGKSPKVHDAVDTGRDFLDLAIVREIGDDKFFVVAKLRGLADVADPDARVDSLEQSAQPRAKVASRNGNQNYFHQCFFRELLMDSLFRCC